MLDQQHLRASEQQANCDLRLHHVLLLEQRQRRHFEPEHRLHSRAVNFFDADRDLNCFNGGVGRHHLHLHSET